MMAFDERIPASAFGLRSELHVLGFAPGRSPSSPWAEVPCVDPLYRFDPLFLEAFREWWETDETQLPLLLAGPDGTGKHSFCEQFLARVHAPVVRVHAGRSVTRASLIPEESGGARRGLFASAFTSACVLLVDELALASPELRDLCLEAASCGSVLHLRDGSRLERHPDFRMVMCLSGTRRLRDRGSWITEMRSQCRQMALGYLVPEEERAMLAQRCAPAAQGLPEEFVDEVTDALLLFARRTRPWADRHDPRILPAVGHGLTIRLLKTLLTWIQGGCTSMPDVAERLLSSVLAGSLDPVRTAALRQLADYEFLELARKYPEAPRAQGK